MEKVFEKSVRLLAEHIPLSSDIKATVREERKIVNMAKINPNIVENVSQYFKNSICAETSRKTRRKTFISLFNRKKRIEFASNYINKPPEFWKQVIFFDESEFCLFGLKETDLQNQNLVGTVK